MTPTTQLFHALNPANLEQGLDFLEQIDPDLASLRSELGSPPLWARPAGFPTLVHIILEQQVSLASARSAFLKLQAASLNQLTPYSFLKFNADELKAIGFSRQKTAACRALASSILDESLDLEALTYLDDNNARMALMKVKGIGPWTADIYLLMVLLRPDSWPSGDLALAVAVQKLKKLSTRPSSIELIDISMAWQPWRAVAARLLWYSYLRNKGLA